MCAHRSRAPRAPLPPEASGVRQLPPWRGGMGLPRLSTCPPQLGHVPLRVAKATHPKQVGSPDASISTSSPCRSQSGQMSSNLYPSFPDFSWCHHRQQLRFGRGGGALGGAAQQVFSQFHFFGNLCVNFVFRSGFVGGYLVLVVLVQSDCAGWTGQCCSLDQLASRHRHNDDRGTPLFGPKSRLKKGEGCYDMD